MHLLPSIPFIARMRVIKERKTNFSFWLCHKDSITQNLSECNAYFVWRSFYLCLNQHWNRRDVEVSRCVIRKWKLMNYLIISLPEIFEQNRVKIFLHHAMLSPLFLALSSWFGLHWSGLKYPLKVFVRAFIVKLNYKYRF